MNVEELKLELKSLKDKVKSFKFLSGNKNKYVKIKIIKNGKIWVNDLIRSDVV